MEYLHHKELSTQFANFAKERTSSLAPVWRKESFQESEGKPETCRYALGLTKILEKSFTPVFPGDLVPGAGFIGMRAPASHPEANLEGEPPARRFNTYADHHAPGYQKLLKTGFGGLLGEACVARQAHVDTRSADFLDSVAIAIEGARNYMRKWAAALLSSAQNTSIYQELSTVLSSSFLWLAENPPRSFHEAVILVYSFHCMMQMDERYAMSFGRMDQYLYPFYRNDIDRGVIDEDTAQTVLDHFFAKITITDDVQNITIGGVKPEDGEDAVNTLSYMLLEACRRVGKAGGNVTARVSEKTPDSFIEKCASVIGSGIGYPALFNDEVEIPALVENGHCLEDARDYCFVGCIEVFIQGKSAPWTDTRFNLLKCVNLVLFNGVDSLTGKQEGLTTGDPKSWDEFYEAYKQQLKEGIRKHTGAKNKADTLFEKHAFEKTSPLMSTLTDPSIERALDLNNGGAFYPSNVGIAGMGIGSTADALSAIRMLVYENNCYTLDDLRTFCRSNFTGYEKDRVHLVRGAPKYGNDNEYVDCIARRVSRDFGRACLEQRTAKGGQYWALMAANVNNIDAGKEIGATPDGRFAGVPVSDAASPSFGRDTHGPTAAIKSVSKLAYEFCPGGNVINMKVHVKDNADNYGNLASLVRSCFNMGGIQLQFNTVDRDTLKKAMEHPEDYDDLIVRVSGFSASFTRLAPEVQRDILARTEHTI